MKILLMTAAVILSFSSFFLEDANAWVANEPTEKIYAFKFHLQGDTFEYKQNAGSYEDAFSHAADSCFKHYKGGRKLSEDRGLDIIDVCANPRSL